MSPPRIGLLSCLVLVACVSQQVETRDSVEPGADFSQLSTYGWADEGASGLDTLALERVKHAVEQVLRAKGWARDPVSPDLRLTVHASRRQTSLDTGYIGGDPAAAGSIDFESGTLVLEAWSADGKPLWRGTAQGALPANPSAEERERRTRTAVEGMLAGFPPPGGAAR
jgi:hypothetical protein